MEPTGGRGCRVGISLLAGGTAPWAPPAAVRWHSWLGADPAVPSAIILPSTVVLLKWVYLDVAGRHR